VVVEEFNTPLSPIDRSSKQKINKEILDLKHIINHMDLADVYKIIHPTSTAAHGTFSKLTVSSGTKQASANTRK
jgi:hypothetical protein